MKLIVPVPAPNATLGVVSVPGAAAGLPGLAPMLSVPIAPAIPRDHNRPVDNAALRNRERAGAKVANVKPRNVAPKGAHAGHPHRTLRACTVADVGDDGGGIDDHPAARDRQSTRAKTADIEPAAWTIVPNGARAGHRHRTGRADRQSDRAAGATVHRTAVLDGKRARALAADHDVSSCSSSSAARRRITVTVPCEPGKLPTAPKKVVNVPPGWIVEHSYSVLTDGEVLGACAHAPDLRRIRRHSVNVCAGRRRRNTGGPIEWVKPAIGKRSGPVGLGVCRNRRCCEECDCHQQSGQDKFAADACPRRHTSGRSYGRQSTRFTPHIRPQSIGKPIIKNWAATAPEVTIESCS